MYRICVLFRHLKGTFMLIAAQDRAATCMRCPDEICRMNYYSKGILFINSPMEVGSVPTVAVPFSGLSSVLWKGR